jgi:O-6-methylguanine DNA methyltransferase
MKTIHKSFTQKVLEVVRKIPKGEVLSYADVARRAARAVGSIMKANFRPDVPCHRVIKSDGTLGNYNRGAKKKFALLKAEGYIK